MRWQYKVSLLQQGDDYDLQRQLNAHGEDEWELIKIDPVMAEIWSNGEKESEYIQNYFAIFKRPR